MSHRAPIMFSGLHCHHALGSALSDGGAVTATDVQEEELSPPLVEEHEAEIFDERIAHFLSPAQRHYQPAHTWTVLITRS